MDEIKLGTIGSGVIVHAFLDNVKITEGIRLAAVYSRSMETGKALAAEYGAQRIYTDMDAFLSDEEVNTVYIATPNLLHYEQAKKALLAGKHVVCEKPFCTQAKQARELVELAKQRQLFLVDAVPTAFLPHFEVLKRELPKIGKVKLVQANYSQYSSRYDLLKKGEVPNIFDPAYGGGCLMDINFYNIYLNIALFGKPLDAAYYPNRYGSLADTSGIMVMQYDGFVSESTGAKDTWGVNFFQIEGEEGYIYVKGGSNGLAEVQVVTKTSDDTFHLQENPDRLFYEVQGVTRFLLDDDRNAVYERLSVMPDVIEVLETARKKAGILFPGEEMAASDRKEVAYADD
ncbi:MAG: Gfo/Idh/MocA family oxidoreductase [Eubacterium sp.]|nr:Gfo/Idh/MocA family oxidoreductase [Eubacterium sp.]